MALPRPAVEILGALFVTALLGASFVAGLRMADPVPEDTSYLFDQIADRTLDIETAKTENQSLIGLLKEAKEEQGELAALVSSLRSRPDQVRVVTKIEVEHVPVERIVIVNDLPDEHLHTLGEGLVVAAFRHADAGFAFETYRLRTRVRLVHADADAAALVMVSSDYEPERWFDVESDLDPTWTSRQEHRMFAPRVGLGLQLGAGLTGKALGRFEPQGVAVFDWFHPHPNVSLLGLRIGGSPRAFRGGLDAVRYNIGGPLPVLTNLWLGLGVDFGTDATFSAGLSLTARL